MLERPLVLGQLVLPGCLFLAPMAGVSDLAFRILCHEMGCSFSFTEMISAKGLFYGGKTDSLLRSHPMAGMTAVQLFGSNPQIMADMAKRLYEEERLSCGLNLNMGCPAPKIVKNGEGSALLNDLPLAGRIMEKVAHALPVPVTVKYRKGFSLEEDISVPFAQMAQSSGMAAVILHGRTKEQMYTGKADWGCVRAVKGAITIPVIGNGDVKTQEEGILRMEETGCDGVMVGRGAFGNPFLFSRESLTVEEKVRAVVRHVDLTVAFRGEKVAVPFLRKHVCAYLKGQRKATQYNPKIFAATTRTELLKPVLEAFGMGIDFLSAPTIIEGISMEPESDESRK